MIKQHIIKVSQTAYRELNSISSIHGYFTEDATTKQHHQLDTSCAFSRLDYCNSLLMGSPNCYSTHAGVQNFTACLIFRALHPHHCTSLLQQLHWLPISEWIKYMAFTLSPTSVPTPRITSPKTSDTLVLSPPSKTN